MKKASIVIVLMLAVALVVGIACNSNGNGEGGGLPNDNGVSNADRRIGESVTFESHIMITVNDYELEDRVLSWEPETIRGEYVQVPIYVEPPDWGVFLKLYVTVKNVGQLPSKENICAVVFYGNEQSDRQDIKRFDDDTAEYISHFLQLNPGESISGYFRYLIPKNPDIDKIRVSFADWGNPIVWCSNYYHDAEQIIRRAEESHTWKLTY